MNTVIKTYIFQLIIKTTFFVHIVSRNITGNKQMHLTLEVNFKSAFYNFRLS